MTEPNQAALLPCPFCGAGETRIEPGTRVWMGTRYGEPASYSVRHWCGKVDGQPSRMIERVGRDEASAIAAWNRRAAQERPAPESAPAPEPVARYSASPDAVRDALRLFDYIYPRAEPSEDAARRALGES